MDGMKGLKDCVESSSVACFKDTEGSTAGGQKMKMLSSLLGLIKMDIMREQHIRGAVHVRCFGR